MNRLIVGFVLCSALPVWAQPSAARLASPDSTPTVRASEPDPFQDGPKAPAARLGPVSTGRVGEGPERASAEERYNWGVRDKQAKPASRNRDSSAPGRTMANGRRTSSADDADGPPLPPPGNAPPPPPWWPERERDLQDLRDQFPAFGDQGDRDRLAFQSDCAFDNFSSPITNPFLAEDPRALTELRPIYIYQSISGSNPIFQGGNAQFLGVQARVAFTDRFSVVMNKMGWTSVNPTNPFAPSGSGFSELWLSPKFTFWRNPDSQSLASAGLQFQLPMGSSGAFQDTGTLALVPYLSVGRRLGETNWGDVNLINVAGYHLGTDDKRSDYFYDTIHLDLDANNNHRFFPTLEMTWFHYTSNGTANPIIPFEGKDLANIGGTANGKNYLSIAPGFRYRFTDYLQFGAAAEFGLVGTNDMNRFRLGMDLIWRY